MTKDDDILGQLLMEKERGIIPEGDYRMVVDSVETKATTYKGTPYFMIKTVNKDMRRPLFVMVVSPYSGTYSFLNYLLPRMIGDIVTVRVKHRPHEEAVYLDCRIIFDVKSDSPQD